MTDQTPEPADTPEGVHELFFVSRDGDSGTEGSSSDDMAETGLPVIGWPDPPMLRVTKDFYERWQASNQAAASKVPPDLGVVLLPTADDVLEPYKY